MHRLYKNVVLYIIEVRKEITLSLLEELELIFDIELDSLGFFVFISLKILLQNPALSFCSHKIDLTFLLNIFCYDNLLT